MYNLIVLSYHRFNEDESEYPFSRTYEQFRHDISKKEFDWITVDDGHESMIRACEMLKARNIRAKLFISINLIEQPGYCTWDDIHKLSLYHDIENHGSMHELLTDMDYQQVHYHLSYANKIIKQETRRQPRYFAAPWNQYNDTVEKVCKDLGLQLMKDRINIKNDTR